MTHYLHSVGVKSPSSDGPPAQQETHLDMRTSLAIKKKRKKRKEKASVAIVDLRKRQHRWWLEKQ